MKAKKMTHFYMICIHKFCCSGIHDKIKFCIKTLNFVAYTKQQNGKKSKLVVKKYNICCNLKQQKTLKSTAIKRNSALNKKRVIE